jgi:hypothetical protein
VDEIAGDHGVIMGCIMGFFSKDTNYVFQTAVCGLKSSKNAIMKAKLGETKQSF